LSPDCASCTSCLSDNLSMGCFIFMRITVNSWRACLTSGSSCTADGANS
jgi:hypothetical protein